MSFSVTIELSEEEASALKSRFSGYPEGALKTVLYRVACRLTHALPSTPEVGKFYRVYSSYEEDGADVPSWRRRVEVLYIAKNRHVVVEDGEGDVETFDLQAPDPYRWVPVK